MAGNKDTTMSMKVLFRYLLSIIIVAVLASALYWILSSTFAERVCYCNLSTYFWISYAIILTSLLSTLLVNKITNNTETSYYPCIIHVIGYLSAIITYFVFNEITIGKIFVSLLWIVWGGLASFYVIALRIAVNSHLIVRTYAYSLIVFFFMIGVHFLSGLIPRHSHKDKYPQFSYLYDNDGIIIQDSIPLNGRHTLPIDRNLIIAKEKNDIYGSIRASYINGKIDYIKQVSLYESPYSFKFHLLDNDTTIDLEKAISIENEVIGKTVILFRNDTLYVTYFIATEPLEFATERCQDTLNTYLLTEVRKMYVDHIDSTVLHIHREELNTKDSIYYHWYQYEDINIPHSYCHKTSDATYRTNRTIKLLDYLPWYTKEIYLFMINHQQDEILNNEGYLGYYWFDHENGRPSINDYQ